MIKSTEQRIIDYLGNFNDSEFHEVSYNDIGSLHSEIEAALLKLSEEGKIEQPSSSSFIDANDIPTSDILKARLVKP